MTCRSQAVRPPDVLDRSPTQVLDWMLCPQYWQWRHVERWRPRTVEKHEVSAWIGSAIHAGISAWVTAFEPAYSTAIMDAAMGSWNQSVTDAFKLGREYEVKEEETIILPTLRKFVDQAPAYLRTGCRGSELKLGHARLDWIGRYENEWLVVDFKTKGKKPQDYWGRAGMEIYSWELRRSWQFADYVERARTHPDSPACGHVVEKMEVHTIILEPFEVWVETFTPSLIPKKEREDITGLMSPGVELWRNRSKCRNWFGGDCPYLRACWDYEGNPQRMTVDYVKESQREGARAHAL